MSEPVLGPLEDFKKFDKLYDEPEEYTHREDCPMSPLYGHPHKFSTLCACRELDKADLESKSEDRADDERKYGGL